MTGTASSRLPSLRSAYRAIPLYGGADPAPVDIDLSDNTNQWGVPPSVGRALAELPVENAARYPQPYSPALARAIGEYVGVTPEMVVTGCGSDQVLDCAFRALANPGAKVAYLDPSFVIVPSFARANSLEPVPVPWTIGGEPDAPELTADVDAVLAIQARIIYLCSPNNPTGTVLPPAVIERIVSATNGLVIVDEAYAEFGSWSAVSLLRSAPNLIVTRTFSKAFGLAGLRIGYALGHPAVVRECAKARGPYALTAFAEPAALAALRHDLGWVREHVALAIDARERLAAAIRGLGGYRVFPSGANFLLVAPDEARIADASAIAQILRAAGIAVRAFPNLPGIGGALRITVAPWEILERCVAALPGAERDA